MPKNVSDPLRILLYLLLGLIALAVGKRWILPWLWPFLLAWAAAALWEPGVCYLCRQGVKRPLAAGLCALCFLSVVLALFWLLGGRLLRECGELLPRLPGILAEVTGALAGWKQAAEEWLRRAPEGIVSGILRSLSDGAAEALGRFPAKAVQRLLGALSTLAQSAPSALLFTVTAGIGAYFISASYPELLHGAAKLLPDRFLYRARLLRRDLRRTLGRWLRAQGLLCLIVFSALSAAFLLLGLRYAFLLALLTAAVDALPVLGAGTVLLPWALYALLTGDTRLGVGLAIVYAAVTLLRSCIQVKLLGDQLGLHPLAALAALYAGWKLWGVWGMIVFPIAAICIKQALPGLAAWRGREWK